MNKIDVVRWVVSRAPRRRVFHNRDVTVTQPPELQEASGLSVSAVARRLGVASATLRSWERRYGLSPSLRTPGAHRRYTESDLALLERMQSLMASGMHPGDAARAARVAGRADASGPVGEQSEDLVAPGARPKSSAPLRGLSRAAASMDTGAAAAVIRTCIEQNGVVWTWDEVIAPVLRSIGDKCLPEEQGSANVDVEHHLSLVVLFELYRLCEVARPVNPRPVLMAAARQEQHSLPVFALGAALAERQICSRILGGCIPDDALAAAVRRTGPVAVFIYAHAPATTDLAAAVPAIRPAPCVVVGGPGWSGVDLAEDVCYPQDLVQAVTVVAAATKGAKA